MEGHLVGNVVDEVTDGGADDDGEDGEVVAGVEGEVEDLEVVGVVEGGDRGREGDGELVDAEMIVARMPPAMTSMWMASMMTTPRMPTKTVKKVLVSPLMRTRGQNQVRRSRPHMVMMARVVV